MKCALNLSSFSCILSDCLSIWYDLERKMYFPCSSILYEMGKNNCNECRTVTENANNENLMSFRVSSFQKAHTLLENIIYVARGVLLNFFQCVQLF